MRYFMCQGQGDMSVDVASRAKFLQVDPHISSRTRRTSSGREPSFVDDEMSIDAGIHAGVDNASEEEALDSESGASPKRKRRTLAVQRRMKLV